MLRLQADVGQGDSGVSCFILQCHHLQFLIFSQWTGEIEIEIETEIDRQREGGRGRERERREDSGLLTALAWE